MLIRIIAFILCSILCLIKPLQVFQQSSYRIKESLTIIKRKPSLLLFTLLSVFAIALAFINFYSVYCSSIAISFISLFLYCKALKKTIVKTNRLKRLIAVYGVILAILTVVLIYVKQLFIFAFCPFILLFLSAILIAPLENKIANKFKEKAKQKLQSQKPITIAITGSFGKTTLKNILARILSTQYSVFVSPSNYNTAMGLAKCINETDSLGDIFIAEAGARYSGDIAEICSLISPKIAVITSITNQHLETFKSEENLKKEKLSILCPSVEYAFFNTDNITNVDYNAFDKKVVLSGKSGDVVYSNVKIKNGKQTFVLNDKEGSMQVECSLLSDYIPSLISTAVSIAKTLGIQEKNIKNAINTLKPIAHRLELLYNGKDVIIDDAYNSNERGFISAVNLLSSFEDKTKVLITPGVVELGKKQEETNERLASYASERVDKIYCYGVNSKAIKRGAKDKCEVCSSLGDCMMRYKKIQGERAVLFENDLPDVY